MAGPKRKLEHHLAMSRSITSLKRCQWDTSKSGKVKADIFHVSPTPSIDSNELVLLVLQHVSHQRVLQLCASQPDALLSVRFLKLFRAPTLSLLTSVMAVCAQKADVDRECYHVPFSFLTRKERPVDAKGKTR